MRSRVFCWALAVASGACVHDWGKSSEDAAVGVGDAGESDAMASWSDPDASTSSDGGPVGDGSASEAAVSVPALGCGAQTCGAHAACVGTAAAPHCECSAGYQGDGQACTDIDECATANGGCPATADCGNTVGGHTCSCKPGFQDMLGDGTSCADKCSLAGCDAKASCSIVGSEPVCTCPSSYTGDGKTCTFDPSCTQLNCDPHASCEVSGADRICKCGPGYTGSGSSCSNINEFQATPAVCGANSSCQDSDGSYTCGCITGYRDSGQGCQNIDDCAAQPCLHGVCKDGIARYDCDCTGTGYKGTECQTDPCSPNPCGSGFNCTRSATATAVCVAACASDPIGCQPGNPCGTDAECKTGGDSTATCDPTAKVCLQICPATSIGSKDNLDAAKFCKEINGDLLVEPGFSTISATDLPYLTRIRGGLKAASVGAMQSIVQSITLASLQTIDVDLSVVSFPNLTLLSFPRLSSVGGKVEAGLSTLQHLSLPQLATIQGDFSLSIGLTSLTQLDIGKLSSVGGKLTLFALCKLPSTQITRIQNFGSSRLVSDVGCCTTGSQYMCVNSICSCN